VLNYGIAVVGAVSFSDGRLKYSVCWDRELMQVFGLQGLYGDDFRSILIFNSSPPIKMSLDELGNYPEALLDIQDNYSIM